MPSVMVKTTTGAMVRTSYFGGPKKGGAAPSATGFMIPSSSSLSSRASASASRPNYLFTFTQSFGKPTGIGGPML